MHGLREKFSLVVFAKLLVWLCILGYGIVLALLLHTHFILTIVFPPAIDRQQLVAHEEKVDRAALTAILLKDAARHAKHDVHGADPFVPR